MIRLILKPAALTDKGQRYEAWWGLALVCTSRQPFYASARVLLDTGSDPAEVLEASHAGQEMVAMRSTVGEAAKWTVTESADGQMRRKIWQPFEHASRGSPVSTASSREDDAA
jgi:hypothetical protein